MRNKLIYIVLFVFLSVFTLINIWGEEQNGIYKERRLKFAELMEPGLAIFAGNKSVNYSGDSDYDFRQNANFYYLTGYDKAGAALIITKGKENKSILFINKPSVYSEIFNGMEPSISDIKKIYGFEEVYYMNDFDDVLEKLPKSQSKIYYSFNDIEMNEKINALFENNHGKPKEIIDSETITNKMRVIKSEDEIKLIQKAVDITNEAQLAVQKIAAPGVNESELQALIEYTFRKNGSPFNGFPSIVGSGKNSCILHYDKNNQAIEENVTIILDIGAEFGGYSADVTRTIPSGGKFTKEQKEIYNIVLNSQNQAIEIIKPGIKLTDVHNKTFEVVAEGLLNLGLITDKTQKWQTKLWYPYSSSHWLGLDTHDAGDYNYKDGGRTLEPGMVFTVEPGIYIGENVFILAEKLSSSFLSKEDLAKFQESVKEAFEKYKNIGVRIEDDILVTETGYKNLSAASPRNIDEIEKNMSK